MRPIEKQKKKTKYVLDIYERQKRGVLSPIMHLYYCSSCTLPICKESYLGLYLAHETPLHLPKRHQVQVNEEPVE